ncbi:TonB-dependent receptor [Marivirga arenosa]|uniref:TonB-dependent receptor plug domain-containing protein n=1 Tax=Marivirga arenosa TaxID=3059076 RepID=A0AA51ZXE3_9BACT|nr:TonB-dependent receptor plug domain-containing protein [Marivirga sp. BKB1-2]WNB18491.1 TonB-dependent receptor plug domain-containing protein [Marivirga sp. BKB1-2]
MKKSCIIILVTLLCIVTVQAQTVYREALGRYVIRESPEKVYLHCDKPQYAAGDDLWFKAYITDAINHLPTQVSNTLYVELINSESEIIDSLALFILNGAAQGSFKFSTDLNPGRYRIRAYTEWMRNQQPDFFYRFDFSLINPIKSDDLKKNSKVAYNEKGIEASFFPEGGDLIEGIATRVAFKITNSKFSNSELKGVVLNEKGRKITTFKSNALGYGNFFIDPDIEDRYLAVIEKDTFFLPTVKKEGAAVKVIHSKNSDLLHITVQAKNVDIEDGTLVIHRRGQILLSENSDHKSEMAVRLKKSSLGNGVIHITFFDKNRIPLSERLIFPSPNHSKPQIELTYDRKSYETRSKVDLNIFSREKDTVRSASITINPLSESSYDVYNKNIRNYLLLSSDLKGNIEFPDYYFTGSEKAYNALDLLMLTHGWSRFNWTSLLRDKENQIQFLPEKGLKLRGKVADYYNDKTINEFLLGVTIPSIGMINDTLFVNNETGSFQVTDLKLMDSTWIFFQVYKKKNEKVKKYKSAKVKLTYSPRPQIRDVFDVDYEIKEDYIEKVRKLNQISEAYFLDNKSVELNEVLVKANKLNEPDYNITTLYGEPSNRIVLDSMGIVGYQNVFDLLRFVPGVRVIGSFPFETVTIRGVVSLNRNATPTFFIDGVRVSQDFVRYLPIEEVLLIDVLKGPDAAIYGTRGALGVIAIYTKIGDLRYQNPEVKSTGLSSFIHPGYHKAKEFYSPNYDLDKEENTIPDYRTTLYWNPDITFENNIATESFFTSDQKGTYIVRIEGMLTNGQPFFEESYIEVK